MEMTPFFSTVTNNNNNSKNNINNKNGYKKLGSPIKRKIVVYYYFSESRSEEEEETETKRTVAGEAESSGNFPSMCYCCLFLERKRIVRVLWKTTDWWWERYVSFLCERV